MQGNKSALEQLLLVFLMILTVSLFSWWGYQSVIYILSQMFNVQTDSTGFTVLVGLLGMISGGLIFAGSCFWWIGRLSAKDLITYGGIGFVVKNIIDVVNDVAVFKVVHGSSQVSIYDIKDLAGTLGGEMFQLAFWVFVVIYFSHLAKKKLMEMPKAA